MYGTNRSSRPEVFLRTYNLLCNFIEIAFQHGCSAVNLLHIFRTLFLKNTSGWLLLHQATNKPGNRKVSRHMKVAEAATGGVLQKSWAAEPPKNWGGRAQRGKTKPRSGFVQTAGGKIFFGFRLKSLQFRGTFRCFY